MENILLCIDDTDNIDSRGTGELATLLAGIIEEKKWGTSTPVTRHQARDPSGHCIYLTQQQHVFYS